MAEPATVEGTVPPVCKDAVVDAEERVEGVGAVVGAVEDAERDVFTAMTPMQVLTLTSDLIAFS